MDALPNRASFELAAKIGSLNKMDDPAAAMDACVGLLETMLNIPSYMTLVESCHNALHHCVLIQSCEAKQQALASIISQIFAAGWSAGRQEIIDAELQRMAASA